MIVQKDSPGAVLAWSYLHQSATTLVAPREDGVGQTAVHPGPPHPINGGYHSSISREDGHREVSILG